MNGKNRVILATGLGSAIDEGSRSPSAKIMLTKET